MLEAWNLFFLARTGNTDRPADDSAYSSARSRQEREMERETDLPLPLLLSATLFCFPPHRNSKNVEESIKRFFLDRMEFRDVEKE